MSITATPNPVHVGEHVTICYVFPPGSNGPVTVRVRFDTHGDPIIVELLMTPKTACQPIEVPAGALGGLCIDLSGGAEDCAFSVLP